MASRRKTGDYSTEWFRKYGQHFPVTPEINSALSLILAVLEDLDLSFNLLEVQNFVQLYDFERL